MRWSEIASQPCSVARTLSVVGDRWTLLLLREAFLGVRRFDAFQHYMGVTRHVLSDRLRKLVSHEILERVAYQERPRRYEYRLTQKGLELHPVITALLGWGDKWMGEGPATVRLRHRACGAEMHPQSVCPECGDAVAARDIELTGPAIAWRQAREARKAQRQPA